MQTKGFLLATASGVAFVPAAQAADLPVKAPRPVPVAAVPSWEGLYIGLHAGAAWQRGSADGLSDYGPISGSTRTTGFIGGGQVGYNWLNGKFLYGLEADLSGLTGTGTSAIDIPGKGIGVGSLSQRIRWISTVRGRLGALVDNNTMAYVTGGVAFGGVNNTFSPNPNCVFCTPGIKSESKTRTGWTVGGGVERMLDPHWIVGLEALWVDLGKSTVTLGPSKTTTFSNQALIGRVKLDYKF